MLSARGPNLGGTTKPLEYLMSGRLPTSAQARQDVAQRVILDTLRSHTRYTALLDKMRLPR